MGKELISQIQTTEVCIHGGRTAWNSSEMPTAAINIIITDTLSEQVITATFLFAGCLSLHQTQL